MVVPLPDFTLQSQHGDLWLRGPALPRAGAAWPNQKAETSLVVAWCLDVGAGETRETASATRRSERAPASICFRGTLLRWMEDLAAASQPLRLTRALGARACTHAPTHNTQYTKLKPQPKGTSWEAEGMREITENK